MMRIIMLVAVATVIIPQSASAQGVNVGGAVRGAVIRGKFTETVVLLVDARKNQVERSLRYSGRNT